MPLASNHAEASEVSQGGHQEESIPEAMAGGEKEPTVEECTHLLYFGKEAWLEHYIHQETLPDLLAEGVVADPKHLAPECCPELGENLGSEPVQEGWSRADFGAWLHYNVFTRLLKLLEDATNAMPDRSPPQEQRRGVQGSPIDDSKGHGPLDGQCDVSACGRPCHGSGAELGDTMRLFAQCMPSVRSTVSMQTMI